MADIETVRQNIQQARALAEQKKAEAQQVEQQLQEQRRTLPDVASQEALRSKYAGMQGRAFRQRVLSAGEEIGKRLGYVGEFKENIGQYEGEVLQAEQQLKAYDAEVQAYREAVDLYNAKIPIDYVDDARVRDYYQQMLISEQEAEKTFSSQVADIQSQLPEGERLIIDFKNMRIKGIESGELGQTLSVDAYNRRIQEINEQLAATPELTEIRDIQSRFPLTSQDINLRTTQITQPPTRELLPLAEAKVPIGTTNILGWDVNFSEAKDRRVELGNQTFIPPVSGESPLSPRMETRNILLQPEFPKVQAFGGYATKTIHAIPKFLGGEYAWQEKLTGLTPEKRLEQERISEQMRKNIPYMNVFEKAGSGIVTFSEALTGKRIDEPYREWTREQVSSILKMYFFARAVSEMRAGKKIKKIQITSGQQFADEGKIEKAKSFVEKIKYDLLQRKAGSEQLNYLNELAKNIDKTNPEQVKAFRDLVQRLYEEGIFKGVPADFYSTSPLVPRVSTYDIEYLLPNLGKMKGIETPLTSFVFFQPTKTTKLYEPAKENMPQLFLSKVPVKTKTKEITSLSPLLISKVRSLIKSLPKEKQLSGQLPKTNIANIVGLKASQIPRTQLRQQLKQQQMTKQMQVQKTAQKTIKKLRTGGFFLKFPSQVGKRIPKQERKLDLTQGFDIIFGVSPKTQKKIRVNLPRKEAMALGSFLTRRTLRASFGLIPSGKQAVSKGLPRTSDVFFGDMFVPSKTTAGMFVEKRKYRLDMPEEIWGIQKARKKRKRLKRKISWW